MSNDQLWTVRRTCVDILPDLIQLFKNKSERQSINIKPNYEFFITTFNNFIFDQQKYVRSSALEIIGRFISILNKEDLSQQFFDFYKNTIEEYFFNVKEFGLETEAKFYDEVIIIELY